MRRIRSLLCLISALAIAVPLALPGVVAAGSGTGAGFTSVNETVDGTGHCKNGNPNVNCNIYDGKQYVWLNGGPVGTSFGNGTYFFAVLVPGSQPGPNDGSVGNLSSPNDAYTNRTFSVSGGVVSYSGTHDFDSTNGKIRLMPYDDTTNPGGVYVLAICAVPNPVLDSPGANPSECKYDAFKVQEGEVIHGLPLTITKDANGAYDNTYTWAIGKAVDKTRVEQVGGSATFNYTVTVTHDGGTVSGVKVTGTISVFNPDVVSSSDSTLVPVDIDGVTDQLSDGTVCSVTNGGAQTLTQFQTDFAYECDLSGLPQGELDNTASVSWSEQLLDNGALLDAGSADFTFTDIAFTENTIDDCVAVTDTFDGGSALSLGTACVNGVFTKALANNLTGFASSYTAPTFSLTYSRSIAVPTNGCQSYNNTAAFTTNDTGATGSASQTVTVCGPARTGALTMGFWQNKNGQAIISGANQSSLGTWLRGFDPFSDAPSAGIASYVYNIIKAATCTSTSKTCNTMLRAQDLATSLDVYFSDPALGGNKISAPQPMGGVSIDLTKICKMIDGSGGTATCSGAFENVSSAFGGATSLTVLQMLQYQNTSDPAADAGANWYGQVKATQVLAKDAFDAINNRVAFGA